MFTYCKAFDKGMEKTGEIIVTPNGKKQTLI
jgi:hypothetical protein